VRVLDLFSGIGGFSLGLERAGMRTVAFCEIEPYCRAVLAKHWPNVPCFPDIRGIDSYELGRLGGVDVICGGFPCQDISIAGKGAGLAGERSGLWSEYARLIGLVRPQYVIVENVAALLSRGLDTVLGDLAALGYDTEWHCIPASYVGALHRRDRVWIVAYPDEGGALVQRGNGDSHDSQWDQAPSLQERQDEFSGAERSSAMGDTDAGRQLQPQGSKQDERRWLSDPSWWSAEPAVGRMAHGVPNRAHRLAALGNAVVPQVVEIIGRAIMKENCNHVWVEASLGEVCNKCWTHSSTAQRDSNS
jgi:DNA (cytosine-5)-methyltransferase 1